MRYKNDVNKIILSCFALLFLLSCQSKSNQVQKNILYEPFFTSVSDLVTSMDIMKYKGVPITLEQEDDETYLLKAGTLEFREKGDPYGFYCLSTTSHPDHEPFYDYLIVHLKSPGDRDKSFEEVVQDHTYAIFLNDNGKILNLTRRKDLVFSGHANLDGDKYLDSFLIRYCNLGHMEDTDKKVIILYLEQPVTDLAEVIYESELTASEVVDLDKHDNLKEIAITCGKRTYYYRCSKKNGKNQLCRVKGPENDKEKSPPENRQHPIDTSEATVAKEYSKGEILK